MTPSGTVDTPKRVRRLVVSTKYPPDRIHLLRAIQAKRGDTFIADTVRHALDTLVEAHFPGATEEA